MVNMNERGQTLVIMVLVMVVALSVGITMSNRFVTSLRTTTRSGVAYRSQAVAEAAVERILTYSNEELIDFIDFDSCGSACVYQITNDDGVVETATVSLSFLGASTAPFQIQLVQDLVNELSLTGYPNNQNVTVCWDNPTSGTLPAIVGYLVYGSKGSYQVDNFAHNSFGSSLTNGFDTTSSANGFDSCFSISSHTTPVFLRMHPMYQDISVTVYPAGGASIPEQGILIESVGQVMDTTKKINVIRGANVVPLNFDYVLYQRSEDQALHN